MHKIIAAAAVLGLLGLPIFASAQSTNQPLTKKESAVNPSTSTKKEAATNATKKAAKKGSMNRQAQVAKKKRLATHNHKMRYGKAKHGKRFAKAHNRHRDASDFSTAKRRHLASVKSRTPNARRAVTEKRTSVQRRAAYQAAATQRNCGQFMYWKNGKCNDARNKPAK